MGSPIPNSIGATWTPLPLTLLWGRLEVSSGKGTISPLPSVMPWPALQGCLGRNPRCSLGLTQTTCVSPACAALAQGLCPGPLRQGCICRADAGSSASLMVPAEAGGMLLLCQLWWWWWWWGTGPERVVEDAGRLHPRSCPQATQLQFRHCGILSSALAKWQRWI